MKKIFYLLALILFMGCGETETKEIIILSTNDMHAKIDNYAKVTAYVDKMRKEHKNVLFLSGGDCFSGNPVVDQYPERGYPMVHMMNLAGYDYSVLGNHEFDYGQDVLQKRIEQANFPFLLANIECPPESVLKQPKPYVEFTMDGIKICILATVHVLEVGGRLIPDTHPGKLIGLNFEEPIETFQKHKSLREKCDLFIGLTHNGLDLDVEVAEKNHELDLIVGGHSHTRIDTGIVVNGVLITQTECWLKHIGKTTITMKGKKVISKKNELILVSELTDEREDVKKTIQEYYENSPLNTVIGKASADFNDKIALGCFYTDALVDGLGLDFAFQNNGGVRINNLAKGDITTAKIYELDPFGNEVIVFELTPDEMKSLIVNSFAESQKTPDLHVSGMTYTIKAKGDKVIDVVMKDQKGKSLDKNKKYKVGLNSFIADSYKFDHADQGKSSYTPSADIMVEYLKKKKEIKPSKQRAFIEVSK